MKVAVHTGELPKRQQGGRTRQANPFDEFVAKGGTHKITLEKGDDIKVITRQLRAAAKFAEKGVKIAVADDGSLIFAVVAKQTRTRRSS